MKIILTVVFSIWLIPVVLIYIIATIYNWKNIHYVKDIFNIKLGTLNENDSFMAAWFPTYNWVTLLFLILKIIASIFLLKPLSWIPRYISKILNYKIK